MGRRVTVYPQSSSSAQQSSASRREWVVDQLPMRVLALECDVADVQRTFADVADRHRAFGAAACLYAAKAQRTGNSELARRRIAGDTKRVRAVRVAARQRICSDLGSEAGWREADRQPRSGIEQRSASTCWVEVGFASERTQSGHRRGAPRSVPSAPAAYVTIFASLPIGQGTPAS